MKINTKPIRITFAKNVKDYRNALKYSQEILAEKTGLSVQMIKDIESCRKWVSDSSLTKLANAFNIPEYELLLPEKQNTEKKQNTSVEKDLLFLNERLKDIIDKQNDRFKYLIDEQFEITIKTGKW